MKIKIRSDKFRLCFYAPLWLCAIPMKNFLTEKNNAGDKAESKGEEISISVSSIIKELRKARRNFGHLKIVDVESASGEKVEITL